MVGDKMEKKATNQGASGGLPTGWASSQGPLPEASGEFLSGYISPRTLQQGAGPCYMETHRGMEGGS